MVKKEEENSEKEKKEESQKLVRTIKVDTPYISVAISSDDSEDSLDAIMKNTEKLLDKYKQHHIISDKKWDYV